MQNKGFVRVFAGALLLVCFFYLSFSFVTAHYDNKAKEYAQGDTEQYYNYMDSVAGEKVWFGYTLKQCREKEINLGLDLKGGMNVTLEVSVADILRALSDYNTNATFNQALENARRRQATSGENFLKLFEEEFTKLDPNARLAGIFSTFDLKDRISSSATNEEVIAVLQEEVSSAISNSFNVLRSRIDRFGVVQPNIQQLGVEGRILVELPGVKEPERVRKLLQGSANLEFWETYKYAEIAPYLDQANALLVEMNAAADTTASKEVAEVEEVIAEEVTDSATGITADELAMTVEGAATAGTDSLSNEEIKRRYPLFSVLQPIQNQGPILGVALGIDTAEVNRMLSNKQVASLFPRDLRFKWTVKPIDPEAGQLAYQLIAIKASDRSGRAPLEGDVITDARADFGQYSASANVSMRMNAEGAKTWARLTKENIGREIAIVLDNYVYSFPTVNTEITGGSSEISGNFTSEEAKDLANVLKSGKMPAPARIVQEDVVGPSLGEKAIHDGMISFIIAFALVLLYMIMYYGLIPGLIADAALLFNVFFMMGILASFKAVLTLPGIAGIVLTLGMAVDANVLIFERIREELSAGKNFRKALKDGYSNAFSAIFDGNVTTLLIGIILAYFGTGPIKGFASTLIIGIITSFFSGVFMSRLIFERFADRPVMESLKFTTNFTKNWFQNTNFNFVKLRKTGYIVMTCFVVIFVISFFTLGFKQGIDFTGGRNFVVRFENTADVEAMREKLSNVFTESTVSVITMGADNQIRVSTNYGIESVDENIDTQIEEMLFNGLKEWLPEGVTLDMFVQGFISTDEGYRVANLDEENITTYGIQSSQKVGPAVADDIKVSAFWSIILALIVMAIYIVIRFRHWSFSLGAVAALAYDSLFMIGIYSLCHSFMPFSLEIDQVFIAAILTIIGYSINDTVVIFDRLRENLGLYPKRDLADQVNISLNTTLSRTFSTSLSTLTVLLAILIFGGETIRGFVFALTVGVIEGVFSTLFVAVPMAYDIEKKAQAKRISNEKK